MRGGPVAAIYRLSQPTALDRWLSSDVLTITLIRFRVEDTLAEMLAAHDPQSR